MRQAPKLPDDSDLRLRGIRALNQTLGPTAALRFLSLIHRDRTNYVDVAQNLYEGQTAEEIFERAAVRWKG